MAEYVKRIAVIKQVKSGFSADGGSLSGIVKLEAYAGYLKVEISLINFAPLKEGKYLFGITDGVNCVFFEDVRYECESALNAAAGFAFIVCFCHEKVFPIASAYCGNGASALPWLSQRLSEEQKHTQPPYDDEAIAEENYYERQTFKDGYAIRQVEAQALQSAKHKCGNQNEEDLRPCQSPQSGVGEECENKNEQPKEIELSGGDFYSRIKGDVEKIFSTYPKAEELEKVIEGSRFAKINYGKGNYYVFGVIYVEGNAAYVCYGVPSLNAQNPPKSFKGFCSYVPCQNGGFWMTYQDARTGVTVGVELA